jgi:hypothetical protein
MPYAAKWKQQEKENKRKTDDSLKLSSPDCREDGEALPSQTLQSSMMSRLHYRVDVCVFSLGTCHEVHVTVSGSERSELY